MLDLQFSIYMITTNKRIDRASACMDSFNTYSNLDKHKFFIVENGNDKYPNSDLEPLARRSRAQLITSGVSRSLAQVWNQCVEHSDNDWVILLNDDVVATAGWEEKLLKAMYTNNSFGCFLITHPNGFSGFAINKQFWHKMGKFNDEFPAGYYEDCDFFLRCAVLHGLHSKKEMMRHVFYSYMERHGEALFYHIPKQFAPTTSWDRSANQDVFDALWREAPEGHGDAYQNKSGKWYIPLKRYSRGIA